MFMCVLYESTFRKKRFFFFSYSLFLLINSLCPPLSHPSLHYSFLFGGECRPKVITRQTCFSRRPLSLNRQRDEAVIELNVALENICAQAKHALKSVKRNKATSLVRNHSRENVFKKRKKPLSTVITSIESKSNSLPCPVEFDTFKRPFGNNGGSSWPIE